MKTKVDNRAPLTSKSLSRLTTIKKWSLNLFFKISKYVKTDITESRKHPKAVVMGLSILLLELLVAFVMFIFVQSRNIITTGAGIKDAPVLIFTIVVAVAAFHLALKAISNFIKIKELKNLFLAIAIASVIAMLTGALLLFLKYTNLHFQFIPITYLFQHSPMNKNHAKAT